MPPEFLSSITSLQLSEITIDIASIPPSEELAQVLGVIRNYDEALYRLSNQLKSSRGTKLVLTWRVAKMLPDLATVLPRFSEAGVLQIVEVGY